jgi:hypothetical protein
MEDKRSALAGRRQYIPAVSYRLLSNDAGSKPALYKGQQKIQLAEKEIYFYLTFNLYLLSDRNSLDSHSPFESIQGKVMHGVSQGLRIMSFVQEVFCS